MSSGSSVKVNEGNPLRVQGCVQSDSNGELIVQVDEPTSSESGGAQVEIPIALEGNGSICQGKLASVRVEFPSGSCYKAEGAETTRKQGSLTVFFSLGNTCSLLSSANRLSPFMF